jgi:hypothetical protein
VPSLQSEIKPKHLVPRVKMNCSPYDLSFSTEVQHFTRTSKEVTFSNRIFSIIFCKYR